VSLHLLSTSWSAVFHTFSRVPCSCSWSSTWLQCSKIDACCLSNVSKRWSARFGLATAWEMVSSARNAFGLILHVWISSFTSIHDVALVCPVSIHCWWWAERWNCSSDSLRDYWEGMKYVWKAINENVSLYEPNQLKFEQNQCFSIKDSVEIQPRWNSKCTTRVTRPQRPTEWRNNHPRVRQTKTTKMKKLNIRTWYFDMKSPRYRDRWSWRTFGELRSEKMSRWNCGSDGTNSLSAPLEQSETEKTKNEWNLWVLAFQKKLRSWDMPETQDTWSVRWRNGWIRKKVEKSTNQPKITRTHRKEVTSIKINKRPSIILQLFSSAPHKMPWRMNARNAPLDGCYDWDDSTNFRLARVEHAMSV
jgi:hypothetical protein